MKKIVVLAIAAIAMISCQQNKIGFVDNSELINEYQQRKDIEAKFKGKIEVFQKKTDSLSKAFELEVKETQLKARKASQKKAQELMGQLQQKQQLLPKIKLLMTR